MAKKFHITDDGPKECLAGVRSCPKGGEHYESFNEATNVYVKQLEGVHGNVKTFKKSLSNDSAVHEQPLNLYKLDFKDYDSTGYYEAKDDVIRELLVGRSILKADGGRLLLDDGRVLDLVDSGSCCAWFTPSLSMNQDYDNAIITNVEFVDSETTDGSDNDAPEKWKLNILADSRVLGVIDVEGDSTSGYYVHNFNMNIFTPKK